MIETINKPPTLKLKPVLKSSKVVDNLTQSQPSLLVENPAPSALFKAIGIISGEVSFDEFGRAFIKVQDKIYRLGYSGIDRGEEVHRFGYDIRNKKTFNALRKNIETTSTIQQLVVYPKFIHFPERDLPPAVSFNLLGFKSANCSPELMELFDTLKDLEFYLCGLWQHIPTSKVPVITILKNFSEKRLEFLKALPVPDRVKALKSIHVSLDWRDPLIKPFRFNPRADKNTKQGRAPFVSLKAEFVPEWDVFKFVSLLDAPSVNAPKFLKSSSKDKNEALKIARSTAQKTP